MDQAVRQWATDLAQVRSDVSRIGYFGSYARGDWGVGSDLDIVIIVTDSRQPFIERAAAIDATGLPVSADLLIYTEAEWGALDEQGKFYQTITSETIWVLDKQN
ncbi:MAG: nucleotidyltransferase domain-containing protein [Actinomycetota bacterium]|nr:nucleotidyltransferase domain-containing protein [Actinomycetota bacterium]